MVLYDGIPFIIKDINDAELESGQKFVMITLVMHE